jgi:hypothetical protein
MGSGQVALCDTRLECLCEKNVTHESARKKRVLENIAPLNCGTPRFGFSGMKREKNKLFFSVFESCGSATTYALQGLKFSYSILYSQGQ